MRDGRFDSATIENLFGGKRFDIVSFRESFYYMDNHLEALELARRILTDRGVLYFKAHVADSPFYWRGVPLATRVGPNATVFFSRATLLRILRDHGYSILATKNLALSPLHALEGWRAPPHVTKLAMPILARLMRFLPPDRYLVLARAVR